MNLQIQSGEYPYLYPIGAAQEKCKEKYPGFRILLRIPRLIFPNKDTYTLCYAYFRWFDDIVDSLKLRPEESRFVIERQKRFLTQLYSQDFPEELSTEELFLAHLAKFDKTHGKNIRRDLKTLIGCLEFDADRRGRIISSKELERYVDDNVISYVNISAAILNIKSSLKEGLIDISRAGFVMDYIFDLREDMALGYINIPAEDIEKYRIELDDVKNHVLEHAKFPMEFKRLDSDALRAWVWDKMESLRETLFNNPFRELPLLARAIAESMAWRRRRKFRGMWERYTKSQRGK